MKTIEQILSDKNTKVIDVRSREEYMGGHVSGSENIPLHEVPHRLEEFKAMQQPFVVCCASGNRSGQAERFLKANGIDCVNGGSWMDVNYYQNQLA
jgi:rhodanese-related sulfurtransferase